MAISADGHHSRQLLERHSHTHTHKHKHTHTHTHRPSKNSLTAPLRDAIEHDGVGVVETLHERKGGSGQPSCLKRGGRPTTKHAQPCRPYHSDTICWFLAQLSSKHESPNDLSVGWFPVDASVKRKQRLCRRCFVAAPAVVRAACPIPSTKLGSTVGNSRLELPLPP